jgi:DNA modification methylase
MSEMRINARVRMLVGDVRDMLATLPSDSVDCVVTSPPYWGLRDYGTGKWVGGAEDCDHRSPTTAQLLLAHRSGCGKCGAIKVDGQIGLEPTLGEHIAVMVAVFDEVRRVLKPSGTLWLNYGDCYATAPNGRSAADTKAAGKDDRSFQDKPMSTVGAIYQPNDPRANGRNVGKNHYTEGHTANGRVVAGGFLKSKDLCMVSNRLAIALQDAGWWVRSEIVWSKTNPMPESITDRPAASHEKVWLLTKSERYFFNAEAIKEPASGGAHMRVRGGNSRENVDRVPVSRKKIKVPGGWATGPGAHGTINKGGRTVGEYRDRPGVTPKSAKPKSGIRANASFESAISGPLVEYRNARNVWTIATQAYRGAHFATFPEALVDRCIRAGSPDGGLVLDPFAGSGTVGLVADRLGRDAVLIDISPAYAGMARARILGGGK